MPGEARRLPDRLNAAMRQHEVGTLPSGLRHPTSTLVANGEPLGSTEVGEFHLLRGVACIGVVSIHVLTTVLMHPHGASFWLVQSFSAAQMLLMFSTPAFIFLSAAIVGYFYDRAPAGFLRKRVRFVLLPFIVVGMVLALFEASLAFRHHGDAGRLAIEWLNGSLRNLAGAAHTWFILPIFQFYVLYALFEDQLRRASPHVVIVSALLVNIAYVGFFDATSTATFSYAELGGTPRDYRYSFFFPAWTAYFAVGYYTGRHYDTFMNWLRSHSRILGTCVIATAIFLLWMHFAGIISDVSSRRVDMPLYAIPMMGLILIAGARLQRIPPLFVLVSQLSFGIYLLHPFVLEVLRRLLFSRLPPLPMPVSAAILFAGTLVISLVVTTALGRIPLGSLLVGNIRALDRGRISGRQAAMVRAGDASLPQ
jgi:membrane-bound acyltransferase YfiQ involved in biofilm formation